MAIMLKNQRRINKVDVAVVEVIMAKMLLDISKADAVADMEVMKVNQHTMAKEKVAVEISTELDFLTEKIDD